jgi:branched-chain amino acid transport system permease protein
MDLALQLLVNGLSNGSHYALLGIGFGLIFGTTGIVHFAYGPIYTLAAYIIWVLIAHVGLSFFPSVLVGMVATAGIGAATYRWL